MSQQISAWCFTSYQDDVNVPNTNRWFKYCIYQREICPDTGREHWQGYIEFARSVRMAKLKDLFGDQSLHLEPRQGTREQAREYCRKLESRVPETEPVEVGAWIDSSQGRRIDLVAARATILTKRKREELYEDPTLDQVMTKYARWAENVLASKKPDFTVNIELYDWQEELLRLFRGEPVHRRIFWIWSASSGTGKTTFKDYVSTQLDVLPARGKLTDILYAYDANQIIWFDYTRAQSGYESYDALEELSNIGIKLSTKYTSIRKFVKSHIVVTSNHAPDVSRLPQRFVEYAI